MRKGMVLIGAIGLLVAVLACGALAMLRAVARHTDMEGTGTPALREIRVGDVRIVTFTPVALAEMPTDAAPETAPGAVIEPTATIEVVAIAAETAQATVAVQIGTRLRPTEIVGSTPTALGTISAMGPTDLPVTPNTPTWTPVPTSRPTNTPTPTSTPTATPTYTSTPTDTPSATRTRRAGPWPWPSQTPCSPCSPLPTPCSPLPTPGQSPLPTPGQSPLPTPGQSPLPTPGQSPLPTPGR